MADDITLKMNVDITDAQSAINLFQKTAEKAFKSSNASTQSMGNSLTKTANNIQGLVARMRELENTRVPTERYTALQDTINKLQRNADVAKRELDKIGQTRLQTTQYVAITDRINDISKKLQNARVTLGHFQNAGVNSGQMFNAAQRQVTRYETELRKAINTQIQLEQTGQQFEKNSAWDNQAKKVQVYEQSLQTAKNQMTQLQQSGGAFTSGVNTAEYSKLSQQLAYAVNQGALLSQKINNSDTSAKNLVSTFKSFGTTISRAVSTTTHALNRLGSSSHSTSLLHNKSWKSMLTMVLKYAFGIRSIFLLYKKVRTVIKTGLTEMAKEFDDVRADVDGLKNSWSGFKASLVSAFQPIFSYVVPALTTLINYLTAAMNALANFFALLTGQGYYYKAKKGNESVANAIGGTGSAAAEANEELAEYDDLLVIDTDDSSGGGGGGSGSSGSDAWNWEKVDVTASKWYDLLKDAFTDWDFTEVGAELSRKLTEALNSINWDSIKTKCSNFAKGLATFLNGFINADLFSSIGTTLAEALNTAFTTANTFATTFDWKNLGTSIGAGITSFFTDAEFGEWGETIHNWIAGILDAGIALLENTDFELIGTRLGEFIEGLEIDDLASKVKKLCSSIITAIGDTITGFENNASEKTKLETAIAGLLGVLVITKSVPVTLSVAAVLGGVHIGTDLYETASGNTVDQSFISELQDIWEGLFGEDKIEFDLSDAVRFVWKDLNMDKMPLSLGDWLSGNKFSQALDDLWGAFFGSDDEKVELNLVDAIKFVWKTDASYKIPLAAFTPIKVGDIQDIIEGLFGKDKIEFNLWDFLKLTYETKTLSWGDFIVFDLPQYIIDLKDYVQLKWSSLTTTDQKTLSSWSPVQYFLKPALDSMFSVASLKKTIHNVIDLANLIEIKWDMSKAKEKLKTMGENIPKGIKDGIKSYLATNPFVALATTLWDKIVKPICTKFGIESPAKKMYEYGKNIFLGIVEGFKDAMTSYGWLGLAGDLYNYFKNGGSSSNKMTGSASGKIGYDFNGNNESTLTINTKLTGEAKNTKQLTKLTEYFKNLATEADKGASGKYDSDLTGAMKSGSDIDDIRIKFTNLKSAWTNESATMSASVGGQLNKISDLDAWKTTMSNTAKEWSKSNAEATLNAKSNINTVEKVGISGLLQKLTETANTWKATNPVSEFKTKFPSFGSGSDADKANKSKDEFAKNSWSKGSTVSFALKLPSSSDWSAADSAKQKAGALWDWWDGTTTLTFDMSFSTANTSGIKSVFKDLQTQINSAFKKAGMSSEVHIDTTPLMARGGIVSNATTFIAGEAGKEAVIPLERNLGWMDKMATAISNKIVDMKLPDVVRGALPTNPEFYRAEQEHNNNIENLLEAILVALSDRQDLPDVFVQLNGRTLAKAVADENDKRNKQLGLV